MLGALQTAILQQKTLFETMLSLGPTATLLYADSGETRQFRVFHPARSDEPLTGGQVQENRYIMASIDQVDATAPPRDPRKGDVLTVKGYKFAIQSAVKAGALDTLIAWQFQVRG